MKKMILISNMYPSQKHPYYGTFVKQFSILSKEFFDITPITLSKETHKSMKLIMYIFFYIKILLFIFFKKTDVVYVHYISHVSIPLLICKKVKKFTLYINVHGSDLVPENKHAKKLNKYTQKIILKAERIIVPSSYFQKLVEEEYYVNSHKICIYPSGGIDPKIFFTRNIQEQIKIKEELGLDSKLSYIGYASRIDIGKGWEIFIDALIQIKKENPDFFDKHKIIFIGNGKYSHALNELIIANHLEENILRIGMLNQSALSLYYSIMDWFVFPTYRKGESLGLVGLEAMACGTPIIATDYAGPATYVIHKQNGLLFNFKDSKDLKEKILYASYLSVTEFTKYRNNAFISACQYYPNNLKKDFKNIFKNII